MEKKKYLKDNKELMKEFDFDKNSDIDLSSITMGMNQKVWWRCHLGHSWEASPNNRQRTGCPICANRQVMLGFNDLASQNPDVAKEWDADKNVLSPYEVLSKSNMNVWWKCEKGHSWQSRISNRVSKGRGCPYCSNQKILQGYNDLGTISPALADEWNYEKNLTMPEEVGAGAVKSVWWKCKRYGHEWEARIVDRLHGNGCPFCSGRRTLAGFNDLATVRPELLNEWDYEKNECSPTEISPSNAYKAWWKCFRGHSYKSSVYNRAKGQGCPHCVSELKTSFPEQAIFYYLCKTTEAKNRYSYEGKEIDIYLPIQKIGIEYNGQYYHKDKLRNDRQKVAFFSDRGIRIISIIEGDKYSTSGDVVEYIYSDGAHGIEWVIRKLSEVIHLQIPDVNIQKDRLEIYEQYVTTQKENSLQSIFPIIADSWDEEKNGSIKPDMVSAHSHKMFWWKCDKDHTWQATVNNRTTLGRGCPYCSGKRVLVGFNDLATTNPDLAKEWHPTKNGSLAPCNVLPYSNKKVWWKGKCGHEWQSTVSNRMNGNGCPVCSNQTIIPGVNDLQTLDSQVAAEWNYEKNTIEPTMVGAGSGKKVWWKCSHCGQEWQTSVVNRTKGHGCPYCNNRLPIKDRNDLLTINPNLASEWHPNKNVNLSPSEVLPYSNKKVWWKGKCGHEWQSTVYSRTSGRGCPVCANQIIIPGINDLKSLYPLVASEWNIEKNNTAPTTFGAGSGKKVWWKCSKCGYEWQSNVVNRTRGHGCPRCNSKRKKT